MKGGMIVAFILLLVWSLGLLDPDLWRRKK